MRQTRDDPSIEAWEEPFGWWGPVWASPASHALCDLVGDEILTAEAAALLTLLIERRVSIVVAAGPSGAGKTTLLTALLDYLPAGTRRIYLRGCYEPFNFLVATDPESSILLVNEISPHLPIYLWGPGIRRVLGAVRDGYQLAATTHAMSVDEFVYSLSGYPLRIPAGDIAAIDLLVLLDAWFDGRAVQREVRSIVNLAPGSEADRLQPTLIASRSSRREPLVVDFAAAAPLFAWLGGDTGTLIAEVEKRTAELRAEELG